MVRGGNQEQGRDPLIVHGGNQEQDAMGRHLCCAHERILGCGRTCHDATTPTQGADAEGVGDRDGEATAVMEEEQPRGTRAFLR